jgi:DNA invertase Pin-like site-specific DNA recombinase
LIKMKYITYYRVSTEKQSASGYTSPYEIKYLLLQ